MADTHYCSGCGERAEMLRGLIFNWVPSPAKPKANAALDALEAEIECLQRANEKLRQQVRGIGGA